MRWPVWGAGIARDGGIGVGVGAFSGLFGVGGGIILVPVLVLLGVTQKRAQATSLVMITLAATTGGLAYAQAGMVAWSPALPIIVGGLTGTWLGTALMQRTPDRWLQAAFALLLLAAAVRLAWPGPSPTVSDLPGLSPLVWLGYLTAGAAMGLLSAFLGVGGGIILIPTLIAAFGFTQVLAAGTSLIVMVPIALLGALRLTAAGHTDWPRGLGLGVGAAGGAIIGASLALLLPIGVLQRGFAAVLLVAAAQLAWRALGRRDEHPGPGRAEGDDVLQHADAADLDDDPVPLPEGEVQPGHDARPGREDGPAGEPVLPAQI